MKKPFKSHLAPLLEQYLAYRRSLGFTSDTHGSLLRGFDEHLAKNRLGLGDLTPAFFLEFKHALCTSACTRNQKLSAMRSFFDYLKRRQIVLRNPLKDIPPDTQNAYIPFIFSPSQTRQLLRACEKTIRCQQAHFFADLGVYTAILLLACCGLRISEPLRLSLEHYNRAEGSIYIEKTKFNKDRLIPVPKICLAHMENYLSIRAAFIPEGETQYLLPGLSQKKIYSTFHKAVNSLGLYQPRRTIANTTFGAPTPHSLRHSFAVNTLKSIKDSGGSPQEALPVLAAYMGHVKYRYTAVYLKCLDAQTRGHLVDFLIGRQAEI